MIIDNTLKFPETQVILQAQTGSFD